MASVVQHIEGLFTAREAADYLGLQVGSIHTATFKGLLTVGERRGKYIYFTQEALDDYRKKRSAFEGETSPLYIPEGDVAKKTNGNGHHHDPEVLSSINLDPEPKATRYAIEREPEVTSEQEKMPLCHRCNRQFVSTREYTIKKFTDEMGEPSWYPVCRDGRCDPVLVNARLAYNEQLALKREQKRSTKLYNSLKALHTEIGKIIAEYEEK